MRYLLLDRITELRPPERATGIKCVSLSEDFFLDHFPGYPVMPGALIMESMAQIGGVLIEAAMREKGRMDLHAILLKADQLKFRKIVRPGDAMVVEANMLSVSEDGGRVKTFARVGDVVVSEGELTYAFTVITNPVLIAKRREVLNTWLMGSAETL